MPDYDPRETSASRRARRPERDPRDIVTEYAFQVDPALLGVPLAGGFRRLAAVVTDLALLAVLFPFKAVLDGLLGGVTDLLVAALAAWVLWRLGEERREPSLASRVITWAGRAAAAGVFLLAAITFVAGLFGGDGDPPAPEAGDAPAAAGPGAADTTTAAPAASSVSDRVAGAVDQVPGVEAPPGARPGGADVEEMLAGVGDARTLAKAASPEEAQPAADRLARRLQRMGLRPGRIADELRDDVESEGETSERPWMADVLRRAAARAESAAAARQARGDSLLALWVAARRAGDTARARGLRRDLLPLVAGDSLRELREAREENRELETRVDELTSSEGFLRRTLDRVLDDLGLGFGSAALFFTLFLRLDRGRTPGKRLFGVRVVRLNGERLSWWDAFSRFGGYFVGPLTGFLGWLQVFWDPNRQAIHDKIAGTVAIRTRGPGKRYEG